MTSIRYSKLPILLFFTLFGTQLPAQWVKLNHPGSTRVNQMVSIGDAIYLAGESGVYQSNSNGILWNQVYRSSSNTSNNYCNFIAGDENVIYAVDNEATLIRSLDEGLTWDTLDTPIWVSFYENDGTGMTVIDGSLFVWNHWRLNRLNFGANDWEEIYTVPPPIPVVRFFQDNGKFWISTENGLYSSDDFGDTWDFVSDEIMSGAFIASGDSILHSGANGLSRSLDGGMTWETIGSSGPYYFDEIHLVGNIIYGTNSWHLSESGDFGETWEEISWGAASIYEHYDFIEFKDFIFAGNGSGCFRSADYGETWVRTSTGIETHRPEFQLGTIENTVFVKGADVFSIDNGKIWFASNLYNFPGAEIQKIVIKDSTYFSIRNNDLFKSNGDFLEWEKVDDTGFPIGAHQLLVYDEYLLAFTYNNKVHRSDDNGLNWEDLGNFPGDVGTVFRFGDILYASDVSLSNIVKSEDIGDSWQGYNLIIDVDGGISNRYGISETFTTEYGKLYALDTEEGFFESYGDLSMWEKISDSLELHPDFYGYNNISKILFNPKGIFIFPRINHNEIFHSPDFGQNWRRIDEGIDWSTGYILGVVETEDAIYLSMKDQGIYRFDLSNVGAQVGSGEIFSDENLNGLNDGNENPLPGILMERRPSENHTYTNNDGIYYTFNSSTIDTIFPIAPIPYIDFVPPYYVLDSLHDGMDFAAQLEPDVKDLCLTLTSWGPYRPGFETNATITFFNIGTTVQSGEVVLHLDQKLEFVSAEPAPTSVNGNIYSWAFSDMALLESRQINFKVLTPTTVPLGAGLLFRASVEPLDNDANKRNNIAVVHDNVVGSYDPNDKQFEPAHFSTADLEENNPLTYTVRFQNTGNYPASFVRIVDTLSADFDISSFQVLSHSHPMIWSIEERGIVTFFFDEINLPDSISNEPESHGFVKFSAIADSTLGLGDTILNTAHIYFDYNQPITTNTTISEIKPPIYTEITDVFLCEGDTLDGIVYTENTLLADTVSLLFFDSVYTTAIYILPPFLSNIEEAVCSNEFYFFNGQELNQPGIYIDTLSSYFGCDSIVELNLLVNTAELVPMDTLDVSICEGDSVLYGEEYILEPDIYFDTLSNFFGCDSLSALELHVWDTSEVVLDTTVLSGTILFGEEITGDTSIVFYYQTVQGCDSLVTFKVDVLTHVDHLEKKANFNISPNPTLNKLKIQNNGTVTCCYDLGLADVFGKMIMKYSAISVDEFELDMSNLSRGIYYIIIYGKSGLYFEKIIKI